MMSQALPIRRFPPRLLRQAVVLGCLLALFGGSAAEARHKPPAAPVLADSPPLGWDSWDSYGLSITADEFRRNVDWFDDHLKPVGWQYVLVEGGWYLAHPERSSERGEDGKYSAAGYTLDANGRYLPAENRFPDGGLKALADYAHARGLRFGIHTMKGIPKAAVEANLPIAGSNFHAADAADTSDACRWNPDNWGIKDNAAGQAYYDALLAMYAGWGVDYLKVDCISNPYNAHEIHMLHAAIEHSGRPIVLSLSPGPTPIEQAADVQKNAQMWRISDDFWDVWSDPSLALGSFPQTVEHEFTDLARWESFAGPGHWPDPDMLPIGYLGPRPGWGQPRNSRLNYDETRTLLTLMAISRSPLILGANLTQLDAFVASLLTNPEILFVDQHSTGSHLLPGVGEAGKSVVWRGEEPKGGKRDFFAVFNLGDTPLTFSYPWKQLGRRGSMHRVRDLWNAEELGRLPALAGTLPPHGSAMYRVD